MKIILASRSWTLQQGKQEINLYPLFLASRNDLTYLQRARMDMLERGLTGPR